MRPDLEPAIRLILKREAFFRANTHTNKELSRKTGLTVVQVGNAIGRLVRAQRKKIQINVQEGKPDDHRSP